MLFRSEIISADSRQIYKELEFGTAKPSEAEMAGVPHHFIACRSIKEDHDAGQYGRDALALIDKLFRKHDWLILCGGSGLYVKSVCEGFDEMPEVATEIRNGIIKEYEKKGLAWLQKEVEEADPDYFSVVDQKNPQRLMRALELYYATGRGFTSLRRQRKLDHAFRIIKIGLEMNRLHLYSRLEQRMNKMIEARSEERRVGKECRL